VAEFNRQKSRLEKMGQQIKKAKVVAPAEGIVVYATSAQFSRRSNIEPLDEGQEVRERQELIHLPTGNTFKAEVNIHEASLKKIYKGLPVRITIDALPGRTFMGKVARIAPLPDARSMFMNPDLKVFRTQIDIEGGGDVLRTGMTCQAEIIVEQYGKTTYVPVQCVVRVRGEPTVFVVGGDAREPRAVEIGLDNNRMVRIIKGLKAGETVMLTPPLDGTATVRAPEQVSDLDIPPRPEARETTRRSPSTRSRGSKGGGPSSGRRDSEGRGTSSGGRDPGGGGASSRRRDFQRDGSTPRDRGSQGDAQRDRGKRRGPDR